MAIPILGFRVFTVYTGTITFTIYHSLSRIQSPQATINNLSIPLTTGTGVEVFGTLGSGSAGFRVRD